MTENQGGPGKPKHEPRAGKKNAAALSAALRANLQRRKSRERALRNAQEARHDDSAPLSALEDGAAQTDKARWTE